MSGVQYAKRWRRVLAQIIDVALIFFFSVALLMMFWFPASLFKWSVFWLFLAYSTFSDAYRDGTAGKHIMGIKVLCTSDARSKLLTAFYRNLTKVVLGILLFEFIWILI